MIYLLIAYLFFSTVAQARCTYTTENNIVDGYILRNPEPTENCTHVLRLSESARNRYGVSAFCLIVEDENIYMKNAGQDYLAVISRPKWDENLEEYQSVQLLNTFTADTLLSGALVCDQEE